MATGGKNGCFRYENLEVLRGLHKVVLFPDLGATEYWSQKTDIMKDMGIEVRIFDYLEKWATPEQRNEGLTLSISYWRQSVQKYSSTNDLRKYNSKIKYEWG